MPLNRISLLFIACALFLIPSSTQAAFGFGHTGYGGGQEGFGGPEVWTVALPTTPQSPEDARQYCENFAPNLTTYGIATEYENIWCVVRHSGPNINDGEAIDLNQGGVSGGPEAIYYKQMPSVHGRISGMTWSGGDDCQTGPSVMCSLFRHEGTRPDVVGAVGGPAIGSVGQPVALYGSAMNTGTGPMYSGFPNIIQVCDTGCATVNSVLSAGNATALVEGTSQSVAASFTPTRAGMHYYRVCANTNTGFANPISEPNINNNCSGWQTLDVSANQFPTQPSGLSASCSADGTSVTLSWSPVSGASSYFVRMDDSRNNRAGCVDGWYCANPPDRAEDFYTSTSVTYTGITPGQWYHWWVHGYNANGIGAGTHDGFSCTAASAVDIVASTDGSTGGTAGSGISLSGSVMNTGSAASASFPSLVQVCDSTCTGYHQVYSTGYGSALGAGASQGVSTTWTPSSAGNYMYRVCGNMNTNWTNVAAESNYDNNCGSWSSITVSAAAAPALSCSVSPSSIAPGGSVTYSANPSGGASGPYTWTASDGASVGTGSSVTRTLSTAGTYAMSVRTGNASTSYCPNVTVTSNACSGSATNLSISASPARVRSGQTSTITWSATGVNGEGASCTVTGPGISWTAPVSAGPQCSAGSSGSATISTQSTYTITCGGESKSATVNVIPNFQEF